MLTEGTIIVNRYAHTSPFFIKIQSESEEKGVDDYISLEIYEEEAKFRGHIGSVTCELKTTPTVQCGYEDGKVSYWFSFNRDDRVLKYGKGYVMNRTMCMKYTFSQTDSEWDDPKWNSFFDPAKKKCFTIVELLVRDVGVSEIADVEKSVNFLPYPLIDDFPYLVRDSANATMFDVASKYYLLSANLPIACQQLYAVIASPKLNLEEDNLADAIGYSLKTRGKYLYEMLPTEGRDNADMSGYLRISIGRGSSPGIPYVLELWPPGSMSQVHNHGNCYGLIKVVHGSMNICVYNKTWPDSEGYSKGDEILKFNAGKGEVTWLSPNWYQTHKLENVTDEYCATIQCYKYGNDDDIMWPYFDYWSKTNSNIQEFKPQTNDDFTIMRKNVLEEYADYLLTQ
jgi:hypothetical protein